MLTVLKKGSEKRLLDLVARLKDAPAGYYVIHFCFSDLLDHNKSEAQLKISTNMISDVLESADGNIIVCSDNDVIVICKNVAVKTINKTVFQMRYLYMDDPLAYTPDAKENEDFCHIYEMRTAWAPIFELAKDKMEKINNKNKPKFEPEDDAQLTPLKLASLETELNKTNISSVVRSQPVCVLRAEGFKTAYEESYVNLGALSDLLRTNVDFGSERSLFKYLTNVLDRKMLEYMAKAPHKHIKSAMSLNLNISTVLGPSFADFDRSISEKTKQSIIVEIQLADVFADMQGFLAARELLQNSGYRICLDGLTTSTFHQVDRNLLGFDLAKMFWNTDIKFDARKKHNQQLAEAIEKCGKSRVILARCDNQDAIYYGQALGISLFQGRFVDSILNPDSGVVN